MVITKTGVSALLSFDHCAARSLPQILVSLTGHEIEICTTAQREQLGLDLDLFSRQDVKTWRKKVCLFLLN